MVIGSSKQEISHQIFQTELTLGPSPWPPWQRISLNITDTRYSVVHTYTQHAIHYTEHWYLHTTQNIVIHIRYRVKHFHRTCYTLHRTLFNIVQWYDAHCTEHWYWCTLHRTLVQIAQNIDAHCTEHLHTFHRTFIHIARNIDTLAQNI